MRTWMRILVTVTVLTLSDSVVRADPPARSKAEPESEAATAKAEKKSILKGTAKELHQARLGGWVAVQQIIPVLEAGDAKEFPGGAAWLKDFRQATREIDSKADPETWPMIDVDALVTNNPRYWKAVYEIAPGDPALTILHSGLLYLGCEPARGSYVLVLGLQRPKIPQPVREIMEKMARQDFAALKQSNEATQQGIALFDQGKYAEALKKLDEALRLCPQNGWAHYEWGLTFRQQQWAAAGLALPDKSGKLTINDKDRTTPPKAAAAFAKARKHDPFQWRAYQGHDKEVIDSLLPFLDKGMRNWDKMKKAFPKPVEDSVVLGLSEGLQAGRCHDLALLARQVVVARRGRFAPEDHPFITTSLRKLAPGDDCEEVLTRLAGVGLRLRELIPPERK